MQSSYMLCASSVLMALSTGLALAQESADAAPEQVAEQAAPAAAETATNESEAAAESSPATTPDGTATPSTQETSASEPAEAAPEPTVIEEITVTAQKRSESINTVPMSVSAVTGADLQTQGIADTAALARIVPGFASTDSGYGTPVYFIRGIGFFDTSLAAKATVGVYVDEVPLAFPALTVGAVFDLERVEVLKGPQGTLFGQNATGGAINYIAAKPTDSFSAGYDAGFGNFGSSEIGGFVSGPINGAVRYRVALKHSGSSGWQQSTTRTGDTLGARDFTQGRVLLDWKASEKLNVGLNLNGFLDRSDTQAPQFVGSFQQTPTAFLDPRLVDYPRANDNARQADWGYPEDYALDRDNHLLQSTLRLDYAWTERMKITSLSSYSKFDEDFGQDADGTETQSADFHIVGNVESINQELRLAGDFERGNWVIGANYAVDDAFERNDQYPMDSSSGHAFDRLMLPPIDLVPQLGFTEFDSKAVFANLSYDLTERLSLQTGARYTDTEIDFKGCVTNAGNGTFAQGFATTLGFTGTIAEGECVTFLDATATEPRRPGFVRDTKSESNTSWRVGLDWDVQPGLLYANVSRGFKAGGFPTLPGTIESQYRPVDQEKVTAYELGFKLPLLDRSLQLNGALFYSDYVDKQLKARTQVPIFGSLEALVNIPESEVMGAELDLTWLPAAGWRLYTAVTYVEIEVTKGSPGGDFTALGGGVRSNIEGESFPFTPEWQANADVQYTWSLREWLDAFAGAGLTHRSETNGDFLPDERLDIDAYTLLDLRLGTETTDGKWRVTTFARNVTDEYYWTTATRRTDSIVRYAGMPRTFGLSLTYRFE